MLSMLITDCFMIMRRFSLYNNILTQSSNMFSNFPGIGGFSQMYEMLWKAVIRPHRAEYQEQEIGPLLFKKEGVKIKRTAVTLTNKRGYKLVGSHYQPYNRPCKQLPCVIYLHANSSNQLQAQYYISPILCHDITLFAFDFAGCGQSEGEYISLGYYEREDVDVVFNYLRSLGTVSSIGIFGRSMGAVTALMYADRNHEIGCVVLDSPFSNLQKLCKELAKKHVSNISAFSGIALSLLSKTIKQKNQFKIEEISPIDNVTKAYIPALFIVAENDDFVQPHHTHELYEKYAGDKQKMVVPGNHNSKRGQQVLDKISSFFYFGLHVQELVIKDPVFIQEQKLKKDKEKDIEREKDRERKKDKEKDIEKEEQFDNNFQGNGFGGLNENQFGLGDQAEYNEEEELKKAIQESLKMIQNTQKQKNADKEKDKKKENGKLQKDKVKQKK